MLRLTESDWAVRLDGDGRARRVSEAFSSMAGRFSILVLPAI
jgi:hypothetical protein